MCFAAMYMSLGCGNAQTRTFTKMAADELGRRDATSGEDSPRITSRRQESAVLTK